jgi:glycosyltransferase involved in cell wall biosynthesis
VGERVAVSVVIPAHNEENALPHLMRSLLARPVPRLQIVVVANGCTDATAQVAREWIAVAHRASISGVCVESAVASKPAALNLGDTLCDGAIRVYVDADVELAPDAVAMMISALSPGTGIHLCAPRISASPTGAHFTDSYVRVWSHLPYVQQQVIGCGCYAVSGEGRSRWTTFPDIISDDKFVRLHFSDTEQRVLDSTWFRVHFPTRTGQLIAIRGRWSRGNRQVRHLFPELTGNDRRARIRGQLALLVQPTLWRHLPQAAFVYLLGEARAVWHWNTGVTVWERADSSPIRAGQR